jgi:glutamate racemase
MSLPSVTSATTNSTRPAQSSHSDDFSLQPGAVEATRLAQASSPATVRVNVLKLGVSPELPRNMVAGAIRAAAEQAGRLAGAAFGIPESHPLAKEAPTLFALLKESGFLVDAEGYANIPNTREAGAWMANVAVECHAPGAHSYALQGLNKFADGQILRDAGFGEEFISGFRNRANEHFATAGLGAFYSAAALASTAAAASRGGGNPQLGPGRVDLSNYSGGPTIDVTPGSGGSGGAIVHNPGGALVQTNPSPSGLATTSTTGALGAVAGGANNSSAITSRDQGTTGGAITNPGANTNTSSNSGLNLNSTITPSSSGGTPSVTREGVEFVPEAYIELPAAPIDFEKLGSRMERLFERYDEINPDVTLDPKKTRDVVSQMMDRQQQQQAERQLRADRERASFADPESRRFVDMPEGFGSVDASGGEVETFGVPNRENSDKLLFDIPFGGTGGSSGSSGASGPGFEAGSVSGGRMIPLSQMDLGNRLTLATIEAASAQEINAWLGPMSDAEKLALPEAVHKAILANFDRQVADLSNLAPARGSSDPAAALANSPEMERLSKELLLGLRLDEAALEGGHILEGHGPFNVFLSDSGSGSFVAYPPIKRVLDALGINANLIVTGDHGSGAPYGSRSQDEIVRLVFAWGELAGKISAADQQKVGNVLAMACNTACIADFYRKEAGIEFPSDGIPVLNLIDNTSKLVADPANRDIFGADPVILSTQATVNSRQYPRLISDYSHGEVTAHNIGGSDAPITLPDGSTQILDLATLVNQKAHLDPAREEEVARVVAHYVDKFPVDMTSLVMCCTHYPALSKAFERELASRGMYPVIVDPMTNQGGKIVEALAASVEGREPPVVPGSRRPDIVITSADRQDYNGELGSGERNLQQGLGFRDFTGRDDVPTFWGQEFGKEFMATPVADYINGLAGEDPDPSYFDLRPDELKEQRPD